MFKATHYRKRAVSIVLAASAILLATAYPGMALPGPSLGAAERFAVLAGSTVTNTGPSVVTGDVGVSPGSAIVGFPPGVVIGEIHAADAVAAQAQADTTEAYNALASQPCDANLTGQNLGGLVLTPGVYCFDSSAGLTGTLTLDAQGDPNAAFIFQIGSTLTTASGSNVELINGANACSVFWQVGSSATLGTGSDFVGNIVALTSITLTTGAGLEGRALARNGAVTMDTNTVSAPPACAQPTPPTPPTPDNNNPQNNINPQEQQPAIPITQEGEQESESGEIDQTFDVS